MTHIHGILCVEGRESHKSPQTPEATLPHTKHVNVIPQKPYI